MGLDSVSLRAVPHLSVKNSGGGGVGGGGRCGRLRGGGGGGGGCFEEGEGGRNLLTSGYAT